jgi:alanine-alpha-ketoisovalerate/valine-pyruvate aminotransferase
MKLSKNAVSSWCQGSFFFGLPDLDWRHRRECLRISFAMSDEDVRAGLKLIR